jgi:hypothetical protein
VECEGKIWFNWLRICTTGGFVEHRKEPSGSMKDDNLLYRQMTVSLARKTLLRGVSFCHAAYGHSRISVSNILPRIFLLRQSSVENLAIGVT